MYLEKGVVFIFLTEIEITEMPSLMFLPVLLSQDYLPQHLIRYRVSLSDGRCGGFATKVPERVESRVVE